MKRDLTPRQQMIFNYIQKIIDERGYPPSVREIGEAVGLKSSSTVHSHLVNLEKRGYIRRDQTKPRAIEIIGNNSSIVRVPVIGDVAAGNRSWPLKALNALFPYLLVS